MMARKMFDWEPTKEDSKWLRDAPVKKRRIDATKVHSGAARVSIVSAKKD